MREPAELGALRNRFDEWRSTKTARMPHYDPSLRAAALALVDTCGVRAVADAARISRQTLKHWKRSVPDSIHQEQPSASHLPVACGDVHFVEIPCIADAGVFDVRFASGIKVQVSASVPPYLIARLCAAMHKEGL